MPSLLLPTSWFYKTPYQFKSTWLYENPVGKHFVISQFISLALVASIEDDGYSLTGQYQKQTLKTRGRVAWISSDCLESFSPLSNVWIDRPLMPSSDVTTTRKPGSDFDWLIV